MLLCTGDFILQLTKNLSAMGYHVIPNKELPGCNMKKTVALFFSLFLSQNADSISINPNGTGEFMIVPFYTVNNGLDTYINISNTTNASKAMKIFFMDGVHGLSGMYFNFYLGPWESFAFALSEVETAPFSTQPDAAIYFSGSACADMDSGTRFSQSVPLIPGVLLDTREGWIQIVEMGELIDGPSSCDAIMANTESLTRPSGGIQASASIIDVSSGIHFSYQPSHFVDFFPEDGAQNYFNEDAGLNPSIFQASSKSNGYTYESGIHAISAEIIKSEVINQFNVENGIAAETEWVLAFPTKRFLRPGNGCFSASNANLFDRKGNELMILNSNNDIDPQNPSTDLDFCDHINVLKFGGDSANSILNSLYQTDFNVGFNVVPNVDLEHGQLRLNFVGVDSLVITGVSETGSLEVHGVPVLGFGIQKYYNGNAQPGLLAVYGSSFPHSFKEDKRLLD